MRLATKGEFSSATALSESCAIEVMLRVLQMRLGSESGATMWSLGDARSDTISLDATQRCSSPRVAQHCSFANRPPRAVASSAMQPAVIARRCSSSPRACRSQGGAARCAVAAAAATVTSCSRPFTSIRYCVRCGAVKMRWRGPCKSTPSSSTMPSRSPQRRYRRARARALALEPLPARRHLHLFLAASAAALTPAALTAAALTASAALRLISFGVDPCFGSIAMRDGVMGDRVEQL